MATTNATTATTTKQEPSSQAPNNTVLVALVAVFAVIVVVLASVLLYIYCRRYLKRVKQREENELKVKPLKASKNGLHVTFADDTEDGFTNQSLELSPTVSSSAFVIDIDNSPTTSHSPLSGYDSQNSNSENHVPLVTILQNVENQANLNNSGDSETSQQNNIEPAVKKEISIPELPKLRSRGSKEINKPKINGLNIEDKELALRRASNLFRSDTKAFEFYNKSITNYEIKRDHLKSINVVGKGHFGVVYIGVASRLPNSKRRNIKVAIKTIKSSAPDSEKQEFLYELEVMKLVNSLDHPNIIKLLACVTVSQPYLIILELMANGNLQKFLRDVKSGDLANKPRSLPAYLTEQNLLKFALDIAKGMEAVADLQLLHRDLAARNILVDETLTCKVADFGFAKDVLSKPEYHSKSVFQRPRPTRWLAPESLFTFKHSIQSDIWSYGVVLWEIVTLGNLPYPNMQTREVMNAVAQGYRMPNPPHCSQDIYKLMLECWEERPENRPTFKILVEKIGQLLFTSKVNIDMKKLEEDDYIDTLPPQEQEILMDYAASETLC